MHYDSMVYGLYCEYIGIVNILELLLVLVDVLVYFVVFLQNAFTYAVGAYYVFT